MKSFILVFLILTLASQVFAQGTASNSATTTPTVVLTPSAIPATLSGTPALTSTPTIKPKVTPAPSAFTQDSPSNPFYIGLGTGVDIPGSNWDPNYLLAGGANVFAGYTLDKNLAVQLGGEEWFFTGTGYSLYQLRILAEAKYIFAGQGFQPYVLAGPGMVFQSISPSGDSTSNFDGLIGAGVQFDLAPRTHLFVEAKANFILSQSTTFMDIPVSAGIWVGL